MYHITKYLFLLLFFLLYFFLYPIYFEKIHVEIYICKRSYSNKIPELCVQSIAYDGISRFHAFRENNFKNAVNLRSENVRSITKEDYIEFSLTRTVIILARAYLFSRYCHAVSRNFHG